MAAGEQWKQDGDAIVRDLEFDDFEAAMAAVNRVAELAEEANHHPDILVHGYNRVRLTLTHPQRGPRHRRRPRAGPPDRRDPLMDHSRRPARC